MYVKLIHERIEEIHGEMYVFRAYETKTTGYKVKVTGGMLHGKSREIMKQFRSEVEKIVNG